MPATVVGTVGLNEVVTHGWDLARAVGQPFPAGDATIAGCLEFIEPMSQPAPRATARPRSVPRSRHPTPHRTLTAWIALTGRDPAWIPD